MSFSDGFLRRPDGLGPREADPSVTFFTGNADHPETAQEALTPVRHGGKACFLDTECPGRTILGFLASLGTNLTDVGAGHTHPRATLPRRLTRFAKSQRQRATFGCGYPQFLGQTKRCVHLGVIHRATSQRRVLRGTIVIVLARTGTKANVTQRLVTHQPFNAVIIGVTGTAIAAIAAIFLADAGQRCTVKIGWCVAKLLAVIPTRTNRLAEIITTRSAKANTPSVWLTFEAIATIRIGGTGPAKNALPSLATPVSLCRIADVRFARCVQNRRGVITGLSTSHAQNKAEADQEEVRIPTHTPYDNRGASSLQAKVTHAQNVQTPWRWLCAGVEARVSRIIF